MTLQDLFIAIKYKYDNTGLKSAKGDTKDLDREVEKTGRTVDSLNDKFSALGVAITASAVAATSAYSKLNAAMVEFSGRAGQSLNDFRNWTKEANSIARETGAANESIIEQMQRIYSLRGNQSQSNTLSRNAAILESRRLINGALAVEAAMSLQNTGFGRGEDNLQMMFVGAQVGPGDMQDYFSSTQLLGGIAGRIGNLPLHDVIGALTVLSTGGNMRTGASGLEEVISSIFRKPTKEGQTLYESIVPGGRWEDMRTIFQDDKLPGLIRHFAENFNEDQLFQLFGSKEAARAMAILMADPDILEQNIQKILSGSSGDAIGTYGAQTEGELAVVLGSFREIMAQFLEQFGEPFGKVLALLLRGVNRMFSGILDLNESIGGLLAWFAALAASFFAIPRMFRVLRGAVAGIASVADALVGRGKDKKDILSDDKGDKKEGGSFWRSFGGLFGAGAGGAVLGAGFFAALSQMWKDIKFLKIFGAQNIDLSKSTVERKGVYRKYLYPVLVNSMKYLGSILGNVISRQLAMMFARLGIATLYSKITEPNLKHLTFARQRDAQADHFRAGGARGDEPAPGWADVAASKRELASAERNILFFQLVGVVGNFFSSIFGAIKAKLPDWAQKVLDIFASAAESVLNTFIYWFDKILGSIGLFIREFLADPRSAVAGAWDSYLAVGSNFYSGIMRTILSSLGVEPSAEAGTIGDIEGMSSGTSLAQPTIKLTPEQMKAFGIEGDYSNIANAPNVSLINLPTPPRDITPHRPVLSMELSMGDINISGEHADDRFELARTMREEAEKALKNSADYIIQEFDWSSP